MRRLSLMGCAATITLLAACSSDPAPVSDRDTMTQRQRDSTLGQSGLPGARGVGRALEVSDSVAMRNAQLDSVGQP